MHRRCLQSLSSGPASPCLNQAGPSSRACRSISTQGARKPPRSQDADVNKAHALLTEFTKRAARPENYGLKETRIRGREEVELKKAVTANKSLRFPSNEKLSFVGHDREAHDEEFDAPDLSIEPGALVEIRRNETTTQGIVVGEEFAFQRWHVRTLTERGELWSHLRGDIMFAIPSFVSPDIVSRCGFEEIPQDATETAARVELVKRMNDFRKKLYAERCTVGIRAPSTLYQQLRHPDPQKWSKVTVKEVADIINPGANHSIISIFAVHKLLMDASEQFVADTTKYRASQTFYVRPEADLKAIQAVAAMSREKSSYLKVFAQKVRRIIAENKQRTLDSWSEPPTVKPFDVPVFNETDALIIRFLLQCLHMKRSIQIDRHEVLLSSVLKPIRDWKQPIDRWMAHDVLIELGVLAPWQDISFISHSRNNAESLANIHKTPVAHVSDGPSVSPPSDGLSATDEVESIRHDFGDLRVYVIDGEGAQELDDGLSIEPVPTDPGSFWVHVHIADPTAHFSPSHEAERTARKRMETQYLIHDSVPMLPASLVEKSSLGNASALGQPEKVMTFSFRVAADGEMADYNVRAGIVKNLHTLTYNAVNAAMGFPDVEEVKYPFGNAPPPDTPANLDDQARRDLSNLLTVARAMQRKLYNNNIFCWGSPVAEISIRPKPLPSVPIHASQPHISRGFPDITYAVLPALFPFTGANGIVAECMKGAARAASMFCRDRGIPVIRRASTQPHAISEEATADLLARRDAYGQVDFLSTLQADLMPGDSGYTLEPAEHWLLGVRPGEGYTRVTSPLRRYGDLAMHWQIKHALLNPTAPPLFSTEELEVLAADMSLYESRRKQQQRPHQAFWQLSFLRRWMADPRGHKDVPDPLERLVGIVGTRLKTNLSSRDSQCKLVVPEIGLQGILRAPALCTDILLGDQLPVKLDQITLGATPQMWFERR
ncbi:hypothetical protein PLICRDRAFT_31956 [Plicaturopsis crispa FD-325 SS-3]|uniref:RNB domain-containing protein n=1 Tax=Plicaturopsis crispa FD-325 SS-3 TaxID=944288 RepID=A0A0C9SS12_PLICR|nr:hypothetical protein PLICRDRAFT_31956 [Plicaturopsis crispa FD-325 SS-3]